MSELTTYRCSDCHEKVTTSKDVEGRNVCPTVVDPDATGEDALCGGVLSKSE